MQLVKVSQQLRVLSLAAEIQLRQLVIDRFTLLNALLAPFFFAVIAFFALRGRPEFDPTYVVIGAGLAGTWSVMLFSSSSLTGERWFGTLELLVASPPRTFVVVAGSMLGNLVFAIGSMPLGSMVAAFIFGYEISIRDWPSFLLAVLLSALAFWTVGMLLAPIYLVSPVAQRFLVGFEYPVYVLAGFLAPVSLLPTWLSPVSLLLPQFWASVAMHGTSSDADPFLGLAWIVLSASSAVLAIAGAKVFSSVLRRARAGGSLALH